MCEVLRSVGECHPSVDDSTFVIPDVEVEAQRGKATCPRAHSQKVADPGFELRPVQAQRPTHLRAALGPATS